MENFIWKCNSCNHKWKAENPFQCPVCDHDDISIVETSQKLPWKLIISIFIGLTVTVLVILNWNQIIGYNSGNKIDVIIEGQSVSVTEYNLEIIRNDNYFQVNGIEIEEIYNIDLHAINSATGERIYSYEDEFYPCEISGSYEIRWSSNNDKIKINVDPINNFRLTSDADENACEELLEVYVDESNCIYTIQTNMDDNPNLEVSLKENGNYRKGKLVWNKSEINKAEYFYIRINGTEIRAKSKIDVCQENIFDQIREKKPKPSIINSFNLYLSDIENNRAQFTDLICIDDPVIVYKNEEYDCMQFVMDIRSEVKNNGSGFLSNLLLLEQDIFYEDDQSQNKIIKLKITQ
jgi:hypothetical protein